MAFRSFATERTMAEPISIRIEVSPGELIDKITILEIKSDRMSDPAKLANVCRELETLTRGRDAAIRPSEALDRLTADLRAANEKLWAIEDEIRECERRKDFGKTFNRLARAVYHTNDERSRIKGRINDLLGAAIFEEKSYSAY